MERRCPRCPEAPLVTAAGALHEDVCADCSGRFLDHEGTALLCERHLRVAPSILKELTRDGPRRLRCPGCGSRMTLTLLRGVMVDLCGGCGGAWLDEGELSALTRGQLPELKTTTLPVVRGADLLEEARAAFGVAPVTVSAPTPTTTTTTTTSPATPDERVVVRFEVRCTICDVPLDLLRTNWLINQRPWCAACAAPHTGVSGILDTIVGLLRRHRHPHAGPSLLDAMFDDVDALRIAPAEAEVHFGPFFRPVVAPPQPR
jgi:Zn-finger nucleic acid-binding protein